MRLSLLAVPLLLASSALAHADTLIYSGSAVINGGSAFDFSFTTNAIPAISGPTTLTAGQFTKTGLPGLPNNSLILDAEATGGFGMDGAFNLDGEMTVGGFTLQQYDTPGTYTTSVPSSPQNQSELDTLTVTSVVSPAAVTPEPSSFALLGTGMLGVLGAVKRRLV